MKMLTVNDEKLIRALLDAAIDAVSGDDPQLCKLERALDRYESHASQIIQRRELAQ